MRAIDAVVILGCAVACGGTNSTQPCDAPETPIPTATRPPTPSPLPSCITALFLCWDIAGACVECVREIEGVERSGICWTNGAMQLSTIDGDADIAISSVGVECFRELPPSLRCAPGNCTYQYAGTDGRYTLREFRDAERGDIVLQASCPEGGDSAPVPLDAFLAPLADQEAALDACAASLTSNPR